MTNNEDNDVHFGKEFDIYMSSKTMRKTATCTSCIYSSSCTNCVLSILLGAYVSQDHTENMVLSSISQGGTRCDGVWAQRHLMG